MANTATEDCARTTMVDVVPEDLRWTPDLTSREVSLKRIEDIAFTPMSPTLRNQLITRTYGDLAQAMAELLGHDDATWTGFGQWASNTVGSYLNIPIPGLGYIIGQAFGDGNRDVFADIGRAHATFLATVGQAHRHGADLDEAWAECQTELRHRLMAPPGGPGGGTEEEFWASVKDPRNRPEGPNYNQLLVIGFRAYLNALQTSDDDKRSEHILLGNALIALHEQKLLSLALTIGFRSWLRTITSPWRIMQTRHDWRHQDPGRWRLAVEHWWIRFATAHLIGVALPNGTTKTGKSIPPGDRPIGVTPVPLDPERQRRRTIESLDDSVILGTLFAELDIDGRPAECWNSLRDRVAFIIELFAQHQRSAMWFDDQNRVTRPEPARNFERDLSRLVAATNEAPKGGTSVPDTVSHLTDDELDALRAEPTLVKLKDPDSLDFRSVADEKQRRRLAPIGKNVAGRYEEMTQPGQHLDPENCLTARHTFKAWSTLWFMGLLFRSLPDSYASAAGVHVLGQMSNLATDPFRRSGETAHFIIDLLGAEQGWDRGLMEQQGSAYRSVVGVRAMHTIVAHRLGSDDWDSAAYGLPLNQEDVLGAALTFCVPPIEMLEQLGMELDDETRDGYVRFWLGIGYLLGAPYDGITIEGPEGRTPLDYEQARALALAIRRRHRARSVDGVRLTEALTEGVADGFPRSFGWMSPGLMKVLGDPEVTSTLLVGGQRGRRRSAVLAFVFRIMLGFRPARPLARLLIRGIGRMWVLPFLEQGRTKPYRRPRQALDERRNARAEQSAGYWPINCGDAAPTQPKKKDRPRRRRAQDQGRRRRRQAV